MYNTPTFEQLFKQIKTNCWIIGIPFDKPKICVRYYVLFCVLLLMVFCELAYFVTKISSDNFLELTALAPCFCIGILSSLKITCIVLNRHKVFVLTNSLHDLYKLSLNDTTKKNLLAKDITYVHKFTQFYFVLNFVLISVYSFSALIIIAYQYIETREMAFILPYPLLLPFSTDTWPTWFAVYFHSVASGFICVFYFATIDVMYCILTSLVCSNFTTIMEDIKYVHTKDNTIHVLREIVKSHQYILKLAEDLEEIFTAPNLCNVLVGSLEICALGFNLTTGNWSQIPGFILFLLSVLLQILMMSVFGENIIRKSRGISEAAFLCKWYNMDEKSKKIILIIMTRSNKQCQLTSYKFSVISYASFSKIISTSWSYFTILRTVYKPSEVTHKE